MHPRHLNLRLFSLLFLALLAGDEFPHNTAPGTAVRRSFVVKREMAHESTTMAIGGEELPPREGYERTQTATITVVVNDRVEESDEDGVQEFRRTFDEIIGEFVAETKTEGREDSGPVELEMISDLTEEELVFTRGEDGFEVRAVNEDLDEELLADLSGELTFAWFLPEDGTEEGATWSVDLAHISVLTRPGGDMALHLEDDEYRRPEQPDYDRDGDFELTYAGTRDLDDQEFAVIEFSIDLSSARDMTEIVLAGLEDRELPEGAPQLTSLVITNELEGSGEMLWDLAAGRMATLDLELDVTQTETQLMTVDSPDGEKDIVRETVMLGTMVLEFEATDAE